MTRRAAGFCVVATDFQLTKALAEALMDAEGLGEPPYIYLDEASAAVRAVLKRNLANAPEAAEKE